MIGEQTKAHLLSILDSLLDDNLGTISAVHEKDGELSISIAVKLGFPGKQGIPVAVQLSFVKEKVRSEAKFYANERQLSLDDAE
jgi:hypothetical protein